MRNNIKRLSKLTLAMGLLTCHGLTLAGQNSIVANNDSTVTTDLNIVANNKAVFKTSAKKSKTDNEDDVSHATIPVDNSNDTALLGIAYDSQTGELKALNVVYVAQQTNGALLGDNDNNGIDDGATLMGNSKSSFTFAIDKTLEDTLSLIEGSASVSINLPTVTAEGNVDLALSTAASSNVSSYTLFARIEPKKAVWLPQETPGLAGSNADLQPTSALTDWVDDVGKGQPLIDRIGDEFVQATQYSAWLMVNLRFEFHNSEDKKEIGGSLKVGYNGVVEVEGAASWASLDNAETVKVTFTAQQAGGVPTELVQVVPSKLLSCNLNTPEICLSAFEDAITYMKGNFVSQFDNNANYNATRYFTRRYDESGPTLTSYMKDVAEQSRTFASDMALRHMSSYWLQAKQDKQRADYLLADQSTYLNSAEQSAITAVQTAAGQNVTTLVNTITTCRVGAADACDIAWTGPGQLQSYDASVLEIQQ
jgi:hypothetical protein